MRSGNSVSCVVFPSVHSAELATETWLAASFLARLSVCVNVSSVLDAMDGTERAKDSSVLPECEPWGVLRRLRTRSPEEFSEQGVDPSTVTVVKDKEDD